MKKIINFRPLPLILLSLAFGILVAKAFLGLTNVVLFIVAGSLFLITLILLLTIFFIKLKIADNKKRLFAFVLVLIMFFSVGMFSFTLYNANYNALEFDSIVTIDATITDSINITEYGAELFLTDVIIIDAGSIYNLNKNLRLKIHYSGEVEDLDLASGSQIIFSQYIFNYTLIENGEINTYALSKNLGYYATAEGIDIEVIAREASFDSVVRARVKELLDENLSYDNSNLAYAVLFGDKTLLDDRIYDSFKASGIAHMLAVSGLHVGFLVLMLLFIFTSLGLNKKLSFIMLSVILGFYAYLCGFSPSVIRATIMALILLFGNIIGERNDSLSSLSLAGIILLILNPFNLFSLGFLLSMFSVLSIFLLYPKFKRLFNKINIPNWLSSAISLTLSAQIGTLPILASAFRTFSLLGVLTNVLALPIFTVGYLFLFDSIVLTLILPFFSFLFIVPNLSFTFVYLIAKFISSVGFSSVDVYSFALLSSVLYYLLLFVVSNYVMLKSKIKWVIAGGLSVVIILTVILSNLPSSFNYYSVTKINNAGNATFVTTENNDRYLINVGEGDSFALYYIEEFLKQEKVNQIDVIIVTDFNENKQQTLSSLAKEYSVKEVYIQDTDDNVLLFSLSDALPVGTGLSLMNSNEENTLDELTFTSYNESNIGTGLRLLVNECEILFCAENLAFASFDTFADLIDPSTRILVVDYLSLLKETAFKGSANYQTMFAVLTDYKNNSSDDNLVFSSTDYGHLLVKIDYDTLSLS
jgi:competence protein ComEC